MLHTFREKQRKLFKRKLELEYNITEAELVMSKKLASLNERYIFQKGFIQGPGFYIVDFYLPKYKICLELDGDYHLDERQKDYDKRKNDYLVYYRGFKVIRLNNNECFSISLSKLQNLLKK